MTNFKCPLDEKSYKAGYEAGLKGRPEMRPPGMDGLSWWSGYIEGKAERRRRNGE